MQQKAEKARQKLLEEQHALRVKDHEITAANAKAELDLLKQRLRIGEIELTGAEKNRAAQIEKTLADAEEAKARAALAKHEMDNYHHVIEKNKADAAAAYAEAKRESDQAFFQYSMDFENWAQGKTLVQQESYIDGLVADAQNPLASPALKRAANFLNTAVRPVLGEMQDSSADKLIQLAMRNANAEDAATILDAILVPSQAAPGTDFDLLLEEGTGTEGTKEALQRGVTNTRERQDFYRDLLGSGSEKATTLKLHDDMASLQRMLDEQRSPEHQAASPGERASFSHRLKVKASAIVKRLKNQDLKSTQGLHNVDALRARFPGLKELFLEIEKEAEEKKNKASEKKKSTSFMRTPKNQLQFNRRQQSRGFPANTLDILKRP
jgi:hypothetical protein